MCHPVPVLRLDVCDWHANHDPACPGLPGINVSASASPATGPSVFVCILVNLHVIMICPDVTLEVAATASTTFKTAADLLTPKYSWCPWTRGLEQPQQ